MVTGTDLQHRDPAEVAADLGLDRGQERAILPWRRDVRRPPRPRPDPKPTDDGPPAVQQRDTRAAVVPDEQTARADQHSHHPRLPRRVDGMVDGMTAGPP